MRVNVIYYLTAILLGGFHALEPGHGKTVVAAYLIGSKGKKIDAVLLGIVVTLTHTFSVILLAIAAKLASTRITLTEESLHGYLGLVAGLMIVAVGVWMLVQRIRGQEPFHFHSHDHSHEHSYDHDHADNHNPFHGHDHSHDHSHSHHHDHHHEGNDVAAHEGLHTHSHEHEDDIPHDHSHEHSHDHNHTHDHNPIHGHSHPHHHSHDKDDDFHSHDYSHEHSHDHNHTHTHDSLHGHVHTHDHSRDEDNELGHNPQSVDVRRGKKLGYWQLFLLGVSGGLVPCPAAIAILLAAVGSGRLGEGLTYILMFSLGLAAVLIAIGIIVVSAGNLASRFLDAKRFARKIAIASAAIITLIGGVTLINSMRHLI